MVRTRIGLIVLALAALTISSLPHTSPAQDIDPANLDYEALVGDDMRMLVSDSILLTLALTTKSGMSGGSFDMFDEELDDNTTLKISRYPYTHEFKSYSNDWYMPFLAVHAGMFEMTMPMLMGETRDEMTFSGWTVGAAGGARIPLNSTFRFSPSVNLLYSLTENEYKYNDPEMISLREYFDGVLLNWEVSTFTYGPSLMIDAELPYRSSLLMFSSEWTYLMSETIQEDHSIQKSDAHSSQWRNRIAAEIPLGVSVKDMPLSLGLDVSRTDLQGSGENFDNAHLYEVGGQISFNPSSHVSKVSEVYLGAGYTFDDDISGWTFRAGFDF